MADVQDSSAAALLNAIRDAFSVSDFKAVLAEYERLATTKVPRSARLEATCLAARALVARQERSKARALLKDFSGEEFAKPIHYDFLAHAFLDLRNYKEAARMCREADARREARAKEAGMR